MNEKQKNIKDKYTNDINWKALDEHWAGEYTEDYAPKSR